MINTIYTASTGLEGFAKGLSVISENVANLNTVGFKQQRVNYFDLGQGGEGSDHPAAGSGMEVGSIYRQYTQGETRQSENALDAAIQGAGFFVVKSEGETRLTRAGQFEFGDDDLLHVRGSDALVQGLAGGQLAPISVAGKRTNPAKATTRVSFAGTLSKDTPAIESVVIFDAAGNQHSLDFTIRRSENTPGSGTPTPGSPTREAYIVTVKENGVELVWESVIQYDGNGNSDPFSSSINFNYVSGAGAKPQFLLLDFGGTNALSTNSSSVRMSTQDGYAVGQNPSFVFNQSGVLQASYSNGQKADLGQLALGSTFQPEKLRAVDKNMFSIDGLDDLTWGTPNSGGLGGLVAGSIEASNVDLTSQFSELIITQRAYQASSQVVTTTNEMLSVLFEIKGRR